MKFKNEELDEMINEAVKWHLQDMLEPGSTNFKFAEAVVSRVEELLEIEKSFLQSQESLVNSQIELEKLYSMGDLTVDQFYGTVELLRKAEI